MKKTLAIVLALTMLLGSIGLAESTVEAYTQKLLDAVPTLEKSESLYFEDGLTITGMGVHFNSYPTEFDGCFYFPAIEQKTGAHIAIDWRVEDNYGTQVATTLASGQLPDIIQAGDYGISALVSEGAILPIDEYLDLIPNIVAAVGENRMADWREADGHIYTIPTIVNVRVPRPFRFVRTGSTRWVWNSRRLGRTGWRFGARSRPMTATATAIRPTRSRWLWSRAAAASAPWRAC